jgi:CheY-like chemotaxis protein
MKKILLVEDNESQRLLYRDELAEGGYEVILAANGKEALKRLVEGKPDLIILDIIMPEMDGMEVLGRIIREYRDTPIILNTAYSSYRDDFMSWAADAFVVKSADFAELKQKVRQILGESETQGVGVTGGRCDIFRPEAA